MTSVPNQNITKECHFGMWPVECQASVFFKASGNRTDKPEKHLIAGALQSPVFNAVEVVTVMKQITTVVGFMNENLEDSPMCGRFYCHERSKLDEGCMLFIEKDLNHYEGKVPMISYPGGAQRVRVTSY